MADGLKIDLRRNRILEILHRDGQVRVAALARQLGATTVTIRSDLDALALDGYLERVQGGAVQTVSGYYSMEFQRRKEKERAAKLHIARLTAAMIRDGSTLFLNSGTTTYYIATELKRHKNLNIVTNSFSVAQELGAQPTFRVILLGGELNAQYAFTYGANAQEQLGAYRADFAVLGMDGVCPDNGLFTYHAEEAVMDRLMMDRAAETVITASGGKIGCQGFSFVTEITRAARLVTDPSADRRAIAELRKRGVSVVYR